MESFNPTGSERIRAMAPLEECVKALKDAIGNHKQYPIILQENWLTLPTRCKSTGFRGFIKNGCKQEMFDEMVGFWFEDKREKRKKRRKKEKHETDTLVIWYDWRNPFAGMGYWRFYYKVCRMDYEGGDGFSEDSEGLHVVQ